jgi:hypothetical protein
MRLTLILLAFAAGWLGGSPAQMNADLLSPPDAPTPALAVEPDYAHAKLATMRLEHSEGVCSATAIGPHKVLTAAHCVEDAIAASVFGQHVVDRRKISTLRLGLRWARVSNVEFDDHDGAILTTDLYFTHQAKFGPKPSRGDVVFLHGNPDGYPDILLIGRVAGWSQYQKVPDTLLLDVNAWYGCSGAAVFDKDGRIVGIANAIFPWPNKGWRLTASFPLTFPEAAKTRQ